MSTLAPNTADLLVVKGVPTNRNLIDAIVDLKKAESTVLAGTNPLWVAEKHLLVSQIETAINLDRDPSIFEAPENRIKAKMKQHVKEEVDRRLGNMFETRVGRVETRLSRIETSVKTRLSKSRKDTARLEFAMIKVLNIAQRGDWIPVPNAQGELPDPSWALISNKKSLYKLSCDVLKRYLKFYSALPDDVASKKWRLRFRLLKCLVFK